MMKTGFGIINTKIMDYDTWRSETGCSDTPENRGWYDCDSEDECAQYIKDHPEWWENF